jgi:Ala-tRNA(Pro) deacylase
VRTLYEIPAKIFKEYSKSNQRKMRSMEKLVSLLKTKAIDYEVLKHNKTIKTAQEGAEYFGIEIAQTAPTLILKTDKEYYAVIISGDYGRLQLDVLRKLLKVDCIKFAKPEEVKEITGSNIGSVSLINPQIPTLLDRELYRFEYVYGGTGDPETTLKIKPKDIEDLNNIVGYIR